jgi:HEAT repeat protein
MRVRRWSFFAALFVLLFRAMVDGQGLDRNAQRFVNDATRDLKSRDVQKRVDAIDQLATWGKLTTAPLIIGALKDPDARVRAAAAGALWDDDMKTETAKGPLTAALGDPSPEVAVLAAGALRLLGASKADVQQANERGLSASTDLRIQFLAARALIGLGPGARLVNPIVKYLEQQAVADERPNAELAENALEELRDTKDPAILPPMMNAVPTMKKGAHIVLRVLGGMEPRPAGWTTLLIAQATSADTSVRRESLFQMRALRADADVAQWSPVAARQLAADVDDGARSSAAGALESAGGSAHPHAQAVLSAAQKDRSAAVRDSAFEALTAIIGRTGTAPMNVKTTMAKTALPVIQAAIDTDPDQDVREEALEALDALALDPAQLVPLLAGVAGKPSLPEGVRTLALAKLRNRGAGARSAAGAVEKLKGDSSAVVRERAAETLERITDGQTPAAPGKTAAASAAGTGPSAASSVPKPSAEDEARGLSVIRARKVEFVWDQFYKAIGDTDVELVRAFLDAGMSARNPFSEAGNELPLSVAVSRSACDSAVRPTAAPTLALVQLLIARGADASMSDENGNTPVMRAAMGGCDAEVMRTLLKAGGRANAVNSGGVSAFEMGLFAGHDGLDALIAAGYRLPADKVKMYLEAYKANPKAVALIKRASP